MLVVRDANSVVAISPLKLTIIRVLGFEIRRLELIAAAESNYQNLVIGEPSKIIIDSVWNYLVSLRGSWDVLALRNIPESSRTVSSMLDRVEGCFLFVAHGLFAPLVRLLKDFRVNQIIRFLAAQRSYN